MPPLAPASDDRVRWEGILVTVMGYVAGVVVALAVLPTDTRLLTALPFLFFLLLGGWAVWLVTVALPYLSDPACLVDGTTDEIAPACTSEFFFYLFQAAVRLACALVALPLMRCRSHANAEGEIRLSAPPRVVLSRIWGAARIMLCAHGVHALAHAWVEFATRVDAYAMQTGVVTMHQIEGLAFVMLGLLPTAANRRRVHRLLYSLVAHGEHSAAATIAGMVGHRNPTRSLHIAQKTFTGLPFDALASTDFTTNKDSGLNAKVVPCKLGGVDAFLSHSWHDDGDAKWAQLERWAAQFRAREKREPMTWLDKACINQQAIEDSLACLPIFLSGCRQLVILAGPTYGSRLWCVMEMFTFVRMGGEISRVLTLPVTEASKHAVAEATRRRRRRASIRNSLVSGAQRVLAPLTRFDARHATCFKPEEREHLLAVIESGFGDFDSFNLVVRSIFEGALGNAITDAFEQMEQLGLMEESVVPTKVFQAEPMAC